MTENPRLVDLKVQSIHLIIDNRGIEVGSLLLSLEVVEEDRTLLGLLTPVLDNDARAVDDLTGVTLTVKLACTQLAPNPLAHIPCQKGSERF